MSERCDTSHVDSEFGYLVRRVQERTFARFHNAFGDEDLTPAEYATLATLRDSDGVRQGRLAAALGLQESNMAVLIKSLVARGLVLRVRSKSDSRAYQLSLTEYGRSYAADMVDRAGKLDRAHTATLTAEERETLIVLLTKTLHSSTAEAVEQPAASTGL